MVPTTARIDSIAAVSLDSFEATQCQAGTMLHTLFEHP